MHPDPYIKLYSYTMFIALLCIIASRRAGIRIGLFQVAWVLLADMFGLYLISLLILYSR